MESVTRLLKKKRIKSEIQGGSKNYMDPKKKM